MKSRYQKIDDRLDELRGWMDSNRGQVQDFAGKFEMSYIYHENAIEGIVVTGPELVAALSTMDEATDSSLVSVYQEIRTLKQGIDFIRSCLANPEARLSLEMAGRLNTLLNPAPESQGYRKEPQLNHRSYMHEIARPEDIPERMTAFFDELDGSDFRELHPIDQACHLHWELMQIFPYAERTGKLVRLLSNYLLQTRGYRTVIIHATDRQRYYDALRISEEYLRMLMVDAMANSLDNEIQYFRSSRPVPQSNYRYR